MLDRYVGLACPSSQTGADMPTAREARVKCNGAINQGTFNEALNMASLFKAPVIYIVENNGVAMGTQVERSSAEKDLAKRASGYNMPYYHVDGNDVDTVIADFGKAVERGRNNQGPSFIVADTYRFRGHSMSDPGNYRTKDEIEEWKKRDPVPVARERLKKDFGVSEDELVSLEAHVKAEVQEAARFRNCVFRGNRTQTTGSAVDLLHGSRAVLEVRSHEVPFLIEHGQILGRLVYERLIARPDKLYGGPIGSSYQRQGLTLSKVFKPFVPRQ